MKTAASMRKVHIDKFNSMKHRWNWWRHDFETAMMDAEIDQSRWVAMLPSHLDDLSRDAYEEITGPDRGNQYIP